LQSVYAIRSYCQDNSCDFLGRPKADPDSDADYDPDSDYDTDYDSDTDSDADSETRAADDW
jgi:hypothetical protein